MQKKDRFKTQDSAPMEPVGSQPRPKFGPQTETQSNASAALDAAQAKVAPSPDTPAQMPAQGSGMNMTGMEAFAIGTAAGMAGDLIGGILKQRSESRQRKLERQQFDQQIRQQEIDRELAEKARRENMIQSAMGNFQNSTFTGAQAQGGALSRLAALFGGA